MANVGSMVAGVSRETRRADLAANIIFFSKSLLDTGDWGLVDFLAQSAQGQFNDSVTNTVQNLLPGGTPRIGTLTHPRNFFRFRINPSKVGVTKAKINALSLCKGGHLRSFFGNDLTKYRFSGSTGYFRPPNAAERALQIGAALTSGGERAREEVAKRILSGNINITESPVWKKFRAFELFVDRVNGELVMYYDLRVVTGMLTDLSYDEDADNPLKINYNFNFEAYTDTREGPDRLGAGIRHFGVR